jgi:hypothetical protein
MLAHRPLQQSLPSAQTSPSTRQPRSSRQMSAPLSPGSAHEPPQHSAAMAQRWPAGRQPGDIGAQRPIKQAPSQQSASAAHMPSAGAQRGCPQVPATHPRSQQSPGRTHGCPAAAHPAGLRQTNVSLPAWGPHSAEQHSSGALHASPSPRQMAGAHWPPAHAREQHSPAAAQGAPFAAQSTTGDARGTVSSISRRHASAISASAASDTIRWMLAPDAPVNWTLEPSTASR